MREFSNILRPRDPLFPTAYLTRQVVAGGAVLWADDEARIPVAAALAYVGVPRDGDPETVSSLTQHFDYRAAVLESPADVPALAMRFDEQMLAARLHAAVLAVHDYEEHAARLRDVLGAPAPGLLVLAESSGKRHNAEPGAARLVDTAHDLADHNSAHAGPDLAETCRAHGLTMAVGTGLLLHSEPIRAAYRQVLDRGPEGDRTVRCLAFSALCHALATALLAARHLGRATWFDPTSVDRIADRQAFNVLHPPPTTTPRPC